MEGGTLEGTTEGWKRDCHLMRMGSVGSILSTYIIVSDTWGGMLLWWVEHEWVAAPEATDHHMIEIAMTLSLFPRSPGGWTYSGVCLFVLNFVFVFEV